MVLLPAPEGPSIAMMICFRAAVTIAGSFFHGDFLQYAMRERVFILNDAKSGYYETLSIRSLTVAARKAIRRGSEGHTPRLGSAWG